jgi:hypothetical protein
MLSDDRAVAVVVEPTPAWKPIAQNGWTIVKRVGDVLFFTR